jgi:DNA-binding NarL/FixJ family response regulator
MARWKKSAQRRGYRTLPAANLQTRAAGTDIAVLGLAGLQAPAILKQTERSAGHNGVPDHAPRRSHILRSRELDASEFVLKRAVPEERVSTIHAAVEGKTFFSPAVTDKMANGTKENAMELLKSGTSLTPRQQQILRLLGQGYSAKEIGKLLNISSRTVEFHKYRIMEAHGLRRSVELVHLAIRHGLTVS